MNIANGALFGKLSLESSASIDYRKRTVALARFDESTKTRIFAVETYSTLSLVLVIVIHDAGLPVNVDK